MSEFINEVKVQGYVQQHLPTQSGVSAAGKQWTRYETLVNTGEKDPVVFTTFGQNGATLAAIPVNGWVHVGGKMGSRLWAEKQRYFLDLRVTVVYPVGAQQQPVNQQQMYSPPVGQVNPMPVVNPEAAAPVGLDQIPF